jgi:hypothetical protein
MQLADIPWRVEFPEVEEVVVVLTLPVLREIDRQKGAQGRLGKRARAANSLIGRLIDAPEVELSNEGVIPSVRMVSGDEFKSDPSLRSILDYSQPDDAIVGSVSTFSKAHAAEQVKLLSNDNSILLTARRVGIPFHRVPGSWLLPAESDEDQKRMKALEAEISRLKRSEPKCIIEPIDEPWKFTIESFAPLSEPQIRSLIWRIGQTFPEETDFGPRESSTRNVSSGFPGLMSHFGLEEFVPAAEEDILNYQRELYPQWISSCEAYLREVHQKLENRRPAPRVAVNLFNDGSRPAEDVKVSFAMRGGGLLIQLPADEDEPTNAGAEAKEGRDTRLQGLDVSLPCPPAAPKGRWKKASPFDTMERMAALSKRFELMGPALRGRLPPIVPGREIDAFYWKTGTRPTHPRPSTELTCQQWRHRSSAEKFEFNLAWLNGAKSQKSALHVEIHAANLTDPVTKVILVEVAVEVGDTWGEAEALVDRLNVANSLFGLARP